MYSSTFGIFPLLFISLWCLGALRTQRRSDLFASHWRTPAKEDGHRNAVSKQRDSIIGDDRGQEELSANSAYINASKRDFSAREMFCKALNKLPSSMYARCTPPEKNKNGNCFMLSATCSANNIYAVLIRRTLDRNTQKEIVTMRLPFSFRYAADDEQSEPLAYDLHDYLLRPLDLEADMDEDEADALRMQQVRKTFFKDGAIDPFAGSNFADYNQEGYTGPSRIEQLKDFESRTGFLLAMPMRTVERLISGKQTKVSISLVMYDVKTQDVVHLQFTPQMHMGDEITQLVPFVDYSGPTPKMGRPTQQMS